MWNIGYFTDYDRVIHLLPYQTRDREKAVSIAAWLSENTGMKHIAVEVSILA